MPNYFGKSGELNHLHDYTNFFPALLLVQRLILKIKPLRCKIISKKTSEPEKLKNSASLFDLYFCALTPACDDPVRLV